MAHLIEPTSLFYNGLNDYFSLRRIPNTATTPSARAQIYHLHSPATVIEHRHGGMDEHMRLDGDNVNDMGRLEGWRRLEKVCHMAQWKLGQARQGKR